MNKILAWLAASSIFMIFVFGCGNNGSPTPQAPSVSTEVATDITATGATLNGSLNPDRKDTGAWFLWSINPDLSSPCYDTVHTYVGSGDTAISFSSALTGLLGPNTTYYFRIEAYNELGTTQGTILSFQTLP